MSIGTSNRSILPGFRPYVFIVPPIRAFNVTPKRQITHETPMAAFNTKNRTSEYYTVMVNTA